MIGLFKQKSPANIVILLVFGLLLKMPLFLYPKAVHYSGTDSELYKALTASFQLNEKAMTAAAAAFALLYIQALLLNYMVSEYRLISRPTYLPAMSYLLITSLLPEWNYFSAPLLSSTLLIWAFIKLFSLYSTETARGKIYNIGLLAGIASFLFFPSVVITICLLLGVTILRPFRFNELFLLLLGLLTPFYFYAVYLFLNDRFTVSHLLPPVQLRVPVITHSIPLAVSMVLLVIPFLLGGYFIQMHLHKLLIQVRKNWSILLLYLMLTLAIPFINTSSSFYNWVLIAAPFAAFAASAYFYSTRRWVHMSLFFVTVGVILFQQYRTPVWH